MMDLHRRMLRDPVIRQRMMADTAMRRMLVEMDEIPAAAAGPPAAAPAKARRAPVRPRAAPARPRAAPAPAKPAPKDTVAKNPHDNMPGMHPRP